MLKSGQNGGFSNALEVKARKLEERYAEALSKNNKGKFHHLKKILDSIWDEITEKERNL